MEEANFYHALKIDNDRCIGCTHCMKECPTGAIRIRDGKALIHKDWCVDCGECLKSCPTEAIYVEQDDFQRIFDYKCRVALMPTVFIGQFSKYTTEGNYQRRYGTGLYPCFPSRVYRRYDP